jgi:FdhE protein
VIRRFAWQARIERARELEGHHQSAAQLLRFYATLLEFQQSVHHSLRQAAAPEIAALAPFAPQLAEVVERAAPPPMAAMAAAIQADEWPALLGQQWLARIEGRPVEYNFFALALLQPYAEAVAWEQPARTPERCPFCNALPQLGVMRPEGEGASRSLLCGLCGTEWPYRRLKCVACGEEDKELLPSFKNDQHRHIFLAACESCHTYLKCVDLSVDGFAVPQVDDIASLPLSLWAAGREYSSVAPNLFGF